MKKKKYIKQLISIKFSDRKEAIEGFVIDYTENWILKYLTAHFNVFQLYPKEEKICYLGKLQFIDNQKLIIDYLNPKAQWDGQMEFLPRDIRIIEFDTDYVNSLKLVLAHENSFLK
jgi:hypothetical protein